MASVNFLYRSSKENAPLNVRLLFRHKSKDFVIGAKTEIMIYSHLELSENPKLSAKHYWNKYHQMVRLKDINLINKQQEVNVELNKLENYILTAYSRIQPENANKEWLQGVVNEYHDPNENSDIPKTLIEFIDWYLLQKTDLKYGTVKKYNTIKSKLVKRKQEFGKVGVLMSEINDNFRLQFEKVYSDYSRNTIIRDLTEIKTLCRFALEKGLEIDREVLNWKFKLEKTKFVYLNEDEIESIYQLENLSEYLDNARDWLLISCYTGQRVSDFLRFNKSMIRVEKNKHGKEIHLIEFTQKKTGATIALPLHSKVLEILDKRNGDFPREISDQKYNDYIKEVCQKAEINDRVQGLKMEVKERGVYRKKLDTYKKWELVTSHIGRRSFATNNFGKIPTRLLMTATGHTKEEMFLKYIGKTQTEQAKELADYF